MGDSLLKLLQQSANDRSIYMIVVVVAIAIGLLERRRRNAKAAKKARTEQAEAARAAENAAAERANVRAIHLEGLRGIATECIKIAEAADATNEQKAALEDRLEMIKKNASEHGIELENVIAEDDQFTLVAAATHAKLRLKEVATLLQKYRSAASELCRFARSTSCLEGDLKARIALRDQMTELLSMAKKDGFSNPMVIDHDAYLDLIHASDRAKVELDALATADQERFDGSVTYRQEPDDEILFVDDGSDDEPTIKIDRAAIDAAIAAEQPFGIDEQELESAVSNMRALDPSLN